MEARQVQSEEFHDAGDLCSLTILRRRDLASITRRCVDCRQNHGRLEASFHVFGTLQQQMCWL